MTRLAALLATTCWAAAAFSQPATAVPQREVPSRAIVGTPSCSLCTIEVERVAAIGISIDSSAEVGTPTILRSRRGELYIAYGGRVVLYDSTGRFVRTVIRRGVGPANLGPIGLVGLGRGDSLIVVDTSRIVVFSPTGAFVRALQPSVVPGRTVLAHPTGALIITSIRPETKPVLQAPAFPVHLLDAGGSYRRPICGPYRGVLPNGRRQMGRLLAPASSGDIWTIDPRSYWIERCAIDGRVLGILQREPDWLRLANGRPMQALTVEQLRDSATRTDTLGRMMQSLTEIRAIWEDSRKLLWVAANVPDWRAVESFPMAADEDPFDQEPYDSIIEVLDPSAAQIVATTRLPFRVHGQIGGNHLVSLKRKTGGGAEIEIWKVWVRGLGNP